jgi:hypothetical protein
MIPRLNIADNPPCDQTGNLNHTQRLCVIHLDKDGIVFVFEGSFVEIRRKKLPRDDSLFLLPDHRKAPG